MTTIRDDIFPIEIWRLILEVATMEDHPCIHPAGKHLHIFHNMLHNYYWSNFQFIRRRLLLFSSVCRLWREICKEFLYRHLWFTSDSLKDHTTLLLAHMMQEEWDECDGKLKQNTSRIGKYTQRIDIDSPALFCEYPQLPDILHQLAPNIHCIGYTDRSKIVSLLHIMRIITLYNDNLEHFLWNGPIYRLASMFGSIRPSSGVIFSNLQILYISSKDGSAHNRLINRFSLSFPKLKSLMLNQPTEMLIDQLKIWRFPSLVHLSVRQWHTSTSMHDFVQFTSTFIDQLTHLQIPFTSDEALESLIQSSQSLIRLDFIDNLSETSKLDTILDLPDNGQRGVKHFTFHWSLLNPAWESFFFILIELPGILSALQIVHIEGISYVNALETFTCETVKAMRQLSSNLNRRGGRLTIGNGEFCFDPSEPDVFYTQPYEIPTDSEYESSPDDSGIASQ